MSSNITLAVFGAARKAEAKPLYQYDYGQVLKIEGVSLPSAYEVHFGNAAEGGITKTSIGGENGAVIPDEYLTSGADIWAFVYLHTGEDDGETEYVVHIPVRKRPEPSDIEPTPEQQDVITQTIAALNATAEEFDERANEIEQEIEEYGGVPGPKGDPGDPGEDGTTVTFGTDITRDGQAFPAGDKIGDVYINTDDGYYYRWETTGAAVHWRRKGQIASAISPTATVTKSGGTATITITDKNGTTIATISDGTDGDTPERGVDYWTAADQAAIVADVLAALPAWTGGNY